ncbi:hypothetical protein SAMN05660235_02991 [Sporolituus thermophilus DSM 23256]|uniref:Uncharacterized protein n=1 Tax=Sporolituus thermophilus DSM 23256 TaxID=1123285 RepID=A0A1G7PJS3_9FIRM|nr:hypothetical protein SAMN05660235_02991 [Sporolituus thermophilus DSM 23256]
MGSNAHKCELSPHYNAALVFCCLKILVELTLGRWQIGAVGRRIGAGD